MAKFAWHNLTFMRRLLLATQSIGLVAGAIFPVVAAPLLGPAVYTLPFVVSCLAMGMSVGAALYLLVRATLRRQLRQRVLELGRQDRVRGLLQGHLQGRV